MVDERPPLPPCWPDMLTRASALKVTAQAFTCIHINISLIIGNTND
jgi:hypothetical protein